MTRGDGARDVFCRFGYIRSDYIPGYRGQNPRVREACFGTRSRCCLVAIGRSSCWMDHLDLGRLEGIEDGIEDGRDSILP